MEAFIALGVIAGLAVFMGTAVHFGGLWVDRMLHYDPRPMDPSKPIVLPHPQDRA